KYINDWTAKKTNHTIKDLLDAGENTAQSVLVIVNAIYFTGYRWSVPFDVKRTIIAPFFVSESRKILTRMMTLKYKPFRYGECFRLKDAKVIEFAYAGDKVSMYVFLPTINEGGMSLFLQRFRTFRLDDCITKMHNVDIDVVLPKFRLTEKTKLKGVLTSMGMQNLFDDTAADLSGIDGRRNLVVSDVFHQAYVDVNEGSTGATSDITNEQDASDSLVVPFRADHPFVFLIRDKTTGIILFMGVFNSPEEEGLVEVKDSDDAYTDDNNCGVDNVRKAGQLSLWMGGL
ncbi:MAG: serpin family protein, partial [Chromatiales bacterium]